MQRGRAGAGPGAVGAGDDGGAIARNAGAALQQLARHLTHERGFGTAADLDGWRTVATEVAGCLPGLAEVCELLADALDAQLQRGRLRSPQGAGPLDDEFAAVSSAAGDLERARAALTEAGDLLTAALEATSVLASPG